MEKVFAMNDSDDIVKAYLIESYEPKRSISSPPPGSASGQETCNQSAY
jgi:hypothetical protein